MDSERFFGGSPLAVISKLVVMSIVVGIVLSALGLTPADLLYRLEILARRIYDMGFGWVEALLRYFLVGAVIVVPIWVVTTLLRQRPRR